MNNRGRKWLCLIMFTGMAILAAGCKTKEKEELSLAYISKDLSHAWYQEITEGIRSGCEEKGIRYLEYDAAYDDKACLEAVEDALDNDVSAVLLTITNQKLGPEIVRLCEQKETVLVSIDDNILDEKGREIPLVGMPYKELGTLGGNALVRKAEEKGFLDDKENIVVLQMIVPGLTTFTERMEAFKDAILNQTELTEENFVTVEVPHGMYDDVYKNILEYVNGREDVREKKWLICGANDDCAAGAMYALRDMKIPMGQIIACGIGGYNVSAKVFEEENANYIAILAQPEEEGREAVEMVCDYLKEGKEIRGTVAIGGQIITRDNYRMYMNDSNE
jgi:ABC-type sugar transport system substrate-binding protein